MNTIPCRIRRFTSLNHAIALLGVFGSLIFPRLAPGQTPSVPAGITATAASSTQINLSWNASIDAGGSGIAGYNVYRGNQVFVVLIGKTTALQYSDTGLTAGAQYCYSVASYDNAGVVSALSGEVCATAAAQGGCAYSLSTGSASFAAAGGAGSAGVTAGAGCGWTASSAASWITITGGASGSGNGAVSYSVDANSGTTSRSGAMTIAGQTFTVTESGVSCSYSISPATVSVGSAGGSGTVGVIAAGGCGWTASSSVGWITITAGGSGSGNGTVSYSIAPNTTSSALTGAITIADKTFKILEAGGACDYSLSTTSASVGSSGGSGSVAVTGSGGCAWTATSNVSWITITGGGSGSGNGVVTYSVAGNSGPCAQTGTMTIAGQTYTVTQAAPPDTFPPTVKLGSPINSSAVSGSIALTAYASDNACGSGVAKVEFYRDSGVLVGAVASSPYSMVFDTTTIVNGSHSFYAKAYDGAGNTAFSSVASVTVNNGSGAAAVNLQLVGFLPEVGTARDMAMSGTTAYVAGDTWGLTLVDVSTPATPQVLASADMPFDGSYVAVSGAISCVTGYRTYFSSLGVPSTINGFYVISNATASVVGSNESTAAVFNGVAISGNDAYVACGSSGLEVFNISNPSAPALVGTYNTPGYATGVSVVGSYAYVADGAGGLQIINISNPSAPKLTGAYNTPGTAKDVAVGGGVAYVADGNSLQVINVSNPASPVFLGSLTVGYPNSIVKVKVQNSTVYAASSAGGLQVINVSTPSSPVLVSTLAPPGVSGASTIGVAVSGTHAYLANYVAGLGVADISVASSPSLTSSLLDWFAGYKMASTPNLAVVTGIQYTDGGLLSSNGLRVVSLQPSSDPTVVGRLDSSTLVFNGVAMTGSYAYVACGKTGLNVVNLSNPASPAVVGALLTPGYAWGVTVAGSYAYVADGSEGLSVVSLKNPASPASVGWIGISGTVKDVAVVNGLAYLAAGNSLQIVDVSNPAAPVVRGSLAFGYPISVVEVKVQNNIAYLAGSAGGLITVDVSNPSSPKQLGILAPAGNSSASTLGVVVNGTLAYVANYLGGLGVVDVSNPATPVLQATVMTMGDLHDVCVEPKWLYGADASATIDIIYIGQ